MGSSRHFAPGWPLCLFTLAFMPVLIGLGLWQLERAEEKRLIQADMDRFRAELPVPLAQLISAQNQAWRPLLLEGEFDARHIWLLDNRTREGRAGVEVLQAFHDQASGRRILINRGWQAWPDRRTLPRISTPEGQQRLYAEALPASEKGFTLGEVQDTNGWPRIITYIDLARLDQQAGTPSLPWMARLQIGSDAALLLDWPPLTMTSSKHTAYAVQWFALATALLVLFIWAGFRPEPTRKYADEQT